jgi:hypothetical protein
MSQDLLEYQKLVENAMRTVVREALRLIDDTGLPGAHHFYITFRTQDDGVEISDQVAAQYPDEMTIVLEHQFWDLEITDDQFGVTLSFGGKQERLVVPFAAITAFVDPSVKFGLQFGSEGGALVGTPRAELALDTNSDSGSESGTDADAGGEDRVPGDSDENSPENSPENSGDGTVVALDSFRKK